MVTVHPFQAIRPKKDLASKVAVLPYDVIDAREALVYAKDNPYSYFHIDRAEIDCPEGISPYDPTVYEKAEETFQMFLEEGWLVEESEPAYYLYRLTMNEHSQTGIVATTSIQEYLDGKIKKHEFTRPEKEQDRINHIRACDADMSPIFLSYRKQAAIQQLVLKWQQRNEPEIDFESFYEIRHQVWKISDVEVMKQLDAYFSQVPELYIADGHHRTESAVKVAIEKRGLGKATANSERFLSILFPDDELVIYEYNRVINEVVPNDFFARLSQAFEVERINYEKPRFKGEILAYTDGKWLRLTAKEDIKQDDPVQGLDVSLLQTHVIAPLFGITDVRTDKRIDFVGGIRGAKELERKVDSGAWKIAFELYPTQMTDLLSVADANQIMPPKSTWFEPKLLSGLFIYDLKTK